MSEKLTDLQEQAGRVLVDLALLTEKRNFDGAIVPCRQLLSLASRMYQRVSAIAAAQEEMRGD